MAMRLVDFRNDRWRNRRESRRVPVEAPATLRLVPGHAFETPGPLVDQPVTTRNVSEQGLGLRSPVPLDVCGRYKIEAADSIPLRGSRMRIVSCRRNDDGEYDIGARLCA